MLIKIVCIRSQNETSLIWSLISTCLPLTHIMTGSQLGWNLNWKSVAPASQRPGFESLFRPFFQYGLSSIAKLGRSLTLKLNVFVYQGNETFKVTFSSRRQNLSFSFLGVPLTRLFPLLCRTPLDVGRRVQHSGLSRTNMVAILKAWLVELKVPSLAFYTNWKLLVALSCSAAGKDCGSTIWSRTFQLPQSISSVYLTPVICITVM